jgi:ATP-dependent helicase/DNAse subunit B
MLDLLSFKKRSDKPHLYKRQCNDCVKDNNKLSWHSVGRAEKRRIRYQNDDQHREEVRLKSRAEWHLNHAGRQETRSKWIKVTLPERRAYSRVYVAKHRADKLKATPIWADLSVISQFYENCPYGYHVHHVVPLKGKEVCGLHVIENLQYLPARENLSKGNRLNLLSHNGG